MAEPEGNELEKVQSFIKDEVKGYFDDMAKNFKPPVAQPQKSEQELAHEQLRSIVKPVFDADINEAKFNSADAKDYVSFYTGNDDATEYRDKVEETFTALAKAGRPTSRADILAYLVGQEYRSDREKFTDKLSDKRKLQLERAEAAADVGGFATTKAKNDPVWSKFDVLSADEQAEKLEGITF